MVAAVAEPTCACGELHVCSNVDLCPDGAVGEEADNRLNAASFVHVVGGPWMFRQFTAGSNPSGRKSALVSKKEAKPSGPPSRPIPDCL